MYSSHFIKLLVLSVCTFTTLQDFNETMDATRKARGKVIPKKGIYDADLVIDLHASFNNLRCRILHVCVYHERCDGS